MTRPELRDSRRRQVDRFLTALMVCVVAALAGLAVPLAADRISLVVALLVPLLIGLVVLSARSNRLGALAGELPTDPLARLAFASLCLALIFVTWNGLRAGPGLAAADPFLVLAGLCALVRIAAGTSPPLQVPAWLLVPGWLLLTDAILTALLAGIPLSSLVPAVRLSVALTLTPLIIGAIAGGLGALWLAVDCWIVSVAVNCAVGVSDYLAKTTIGPSLTGVGAVDRIAGLTTQANHLAFVAVLALPVVLSRALQAPVRVLRGYYVGVAVLAVLAILGSGSRGGLVACVVAITSVPFYQAAVRRQAIAVLLGAAVALLAAGFYLAGNASFSAVDRLTGRGSAQVGVVESDALRSSYRRDAVHEFAQSPLYGVGFERVRQAHNIYLQLLAAGGLLAAIAFVTFAAGSLRAALRVARDGRERTDVRSFAGALATAMALWLLMGLVENQLYDRYLLVPCGFILGLRVLAETRRPSRASPADESHPQAPLRRPAALKSVTPLA